MRIVGIAIITSLLYACASPSGETTSVASGSEAQSTSQGVSPDAPAGSSAGSVVEASMPLSQGQGDINQFAEQLTLRQQATRMMVDTHVFNAQTHFKNGQLELALADLDAALSLDDTNLEAQKLHAQIQGLMGHKPSEQQTLGEAMAEQHQLRVQQLLGQARDFYNKGQLALSRKEYDSAVAELTLAVSSIRVAPFALDWDGLDVRANELLQRAKDERSAASDRLRLQAEQDAFERLRAEEMGEAQRKQARVNTMVVNAIEAFEARNYESAISYADLALRRSPRNEKALEIRSAAFQAGRKQLNRRYIEERRDEFARWKQYLRGLEIPQSDIVTMPDVDDWRRITELRKGRRGQDLTRAVDPAERELRERMQNTYVTLPGIQEEDSLGHLVDILRSFSDLPMVVDPAAEDAVASAGVTFTLDFPNRITVRQALDFITTEAGEEVTWTIRHEAVMVTTREKARGKLEVLNHDVQDLVVGLTDFTGPRIDKIRLYDELDADEDGGGPFGGTLEARRVIEIENLSTLIQENVAPETWSDEGVSIESGEGFIVVTHTLEVQQAIRAFLEDLRRLNSTLVTIESKFMTVGDSFIQEIGNDFRGLDGRSLEDLTNGLEDQASRGLDNGGTGSTGQDAAGAPSAGFFFDDGQDGQFAARTGNFFNTALGQSLSTIGGMTFQWNFFNDAEVSTILRAVEKSNRYEIINSQILSVHNTSRAYVAVVNQRAFIQDFSVEVAQFQAVADPEINVLHEGIALDVRPTIQHDRKYLKLEVQPTIAKVVNLRTFSTTLGGNTSPVEFQLPELEVQSINTSANLPDGGSVLLGGLSSIRNVERRAEIPWIARVPILGFLFKSEGYNDERESLMILIRAHITDVREEAEKLESADN